MSEWIDIPSHRVLRVSHEELHEHFELYNEDGGEVFRGVAAYRYLRRKDRKVFCRARWQPRDGELMAWLTLEEI